MVGITTDSMEDINMLKDYFRRRQIGVKGDCPTCKQTAGVNEELIFLLQNIANRAHIGDAADMAKRALIILGVETDD